VSEETAQEFLDRITQTITNEEDYLDALHGVKRHQLPYAFEGYQIPSQTPEVEVMPPPRYYQREEVRAELSHAIVINELGHVDRQPPFDPRRIPSNRHAWYVEECDPIEVTSLSSTVPQYMTSIRRTEYIRHSAVAHGARIHIWIHEAIAYSSQYAIARTIENAIRRFY
jgi:hypothetical protein